MYRAKSLNSDHSGARRDDGQYEFRRGNGPRNEAGYEVVLVCRAANYAAFLDVPPFALFRSCFARGGGQRKIALRKTRRPCAFIETIRTESKIEAKASYGQKHS